MNKIVKLLSVFALATTTFFVSCKGDTGAVGPAGPTGATGATGAAGTNGTNANASSTTVTVKATDWAQTPVQRVGDATSSTWGSASVTNTLITTDNFVFVYLVSSSNNGGKMALPITNYSDANSSVEVLNYSYSANTVKFYYRSTNLVSNVSTYAPSSDLQFMVLTFSKATSALMTKNNVDMKDYAAVQKFLNTIQ